MILLAKKGGIKMKNLKKSLAVLLAAIFAVGTLAACGGSGGGAAPAADTTAAAEETAAPAETAAAEQTDAAAAEGGKHFIVATDKGFSPFEFEDENGNIVGIDMDILAAVAEDQGFTYDLHYIGWDAAIAECQAGQADGMIAGASITDERKGSGWIFSDGYYEATQGMAVAADSDIASIEDLAGTTVVVKNGTMSDIYATELSEEIGFTVTRVSTSPDMYQQVMGGQAAACFDDTPILKYSIMTGDLSMKFVEGTENDPQDYGMAIFKPENQELIDLFNAGLANIKENGTYDEILNRYLG